MSLALAAPAFAAPALFKGNLSVVNTYANTLICGPALPQCASSPSLTASIMYSAGNISIPASQFSTYIKTGPTSFVGYPNFTGYRSRTQSGTANFYKGYRGLSTTMTYPANTTLDPKDTGGPREGMVRIKAGPNGFGGEMAFRDYGYFNATVVQPIGYITNVRLEFDRDRGTAFHFNQELVPMGTGTHSTLKTTMGGPLVINSPGFSTGFGFVTGTITVTEKIGGTTEFKTITATDNRTVKGINGTISLVSPHQIWTYNAIGTVVQQIRFAFSSYSRLSLNFLPEPGRLALLGVGLLGLLSLHRLRRR